MSHLELVVPVVRDYDAAIRFFVDVLQFELVEDTATPTSRVQMASNKQARWLKT